MLNRQLKKKISYAVLGAMLTSSVISPEVLCKAWDFDNTAPTNVVFQSSTIPNGNRKITLTFRDTDVKQVLRMLADKSGMNIIFHESVKGTVTLDLVDVTLDKAFKMIIEMTDLSYYKNNGTFMIMSASQAKKSNVAKNEMRVIPIKYTSAASIADFLNTNVFGLGKPGLSEGKIVVTNPSKNEIIIFGTQDDYNMAMNVIKKIDLKPTSTVYKVNHVTPKEMATLLCNTLFTNVSSSGQQKLAGTFTGAASSSSSGRSSSRGSGSSYSSSGSGHSSSGSSSRSGSDKGLELGGGTIACSVDTKTGSGTSGGGLASFKAGNMSVIYHSGLGTITVMGGSPDQINLINEFITMHDRKQPQAVLEFVVLELKEEASKQFENDWVFQNGTVPMQFHGGILSLGKLIFLGDRSGAPQTFGTGPRALYDAIKWVESNDKGRVLQNPKIIVTNGRESVIDMTQDYVEKVDAQVQNSTGALVPTVERTYEIGDDQGMKISIVPFISPDGYVTMDLGVDYSIEAGKVYNILYNPKTGDPLEEKELAATLLKRRNLELNTIRVKNGETLVLGGLIYETESDNVSKIPILGDIPVLGVFFRNTITSKSKNELVLLITPRIIEDTEDVKRL